MKRRVVIAGLLLAATMRRTQAQQKARVYRIAIVHPSHPLAELSETGSRPSWRAFFQRLRELGYVEGQNLSVARYSAEGRPERYAEVIRAAIRGNPDVLYVGGPRLVLGFKAATDTIPVVIVVADPVAERIVPSLARPGGNITGTTVSAGVEIEGKRLQLIREMIPTASKVALLAPREAWEGPNAAALRDSAELMKISLIGPLLDSQIDEAEYRKVFAAITREGADALIVSSDNVNITNRRLIVELAEKARLPAIYSYPEMANIGGLMGYGVDLSDILRHSESF
jgi:putative tryptophan/tyrosine transport system substrate-binding protein